jgi:hypothetical protein
MSFTSDSAPSEARKRGSGGGYPRKHDDLLMGLSDLAAKAVPGTTRRAKRENGGLGEDTPGGTINLLTGRSGLDVQSRQCQGQRCERSEKTGVWGRIP